MKKLAVLLLTSLFVITGCGANKSSDVLASINSFDIAGGAPEKSYSANYDNGMATEDIYEYEESDAASYDNSEYESYDENVASQSKESLKNRKLITTLNMNVETENFNDLTVVIENRVSELGGYIEASNYNSRGNGSMYASYTIRVPEVNLAAFTSTISNETNVTSKSTSVEDVTLSYVDMESRKSVYETEEKRLLEMLDEASDIDTMLSIEMRLSQVQADIESMESMLRAYDNKCSFSTIYLNVSEVKVYTVVETKELSAWEKMAQGFMSSLKSVGYGIVNFFIGFVIALPYLAVYAVIVTIFILIIKAIAKKSNKKRLERIAKAADIKNASLKNNDDKEKDADAESQEGKEEK